MSQMSYLQQSLERIIFNLSRIGGYTMYLFWMVRFFWGYFYYACVYVFYVQCLKICRPNWYHRDWMGMFLLFGNFPSFCMYVLFFHFFNYILLIMLLQLFEFLPLCPLWLSTPHSLGHSPFLCSCPSVMHISSLATPFPILYYTSPWLFCDCLFVLPNPLTHSPILPSHLATIKTLSESMILSLFFSLCFRFNCW